MYNINIPSSIKKKDNLLFEAHFNAETSTRFFQDGTKYNNYT